MAREKRISARKAQELLNVDEDKFQNLVARGDLEAFREGGADSFSEEGVRSLRRRIAANQGIREEPVAAALSTTSPPTEPGIVTVNINALPNHTGTKERAHINASDLATMANASGRI